MSDLLQAIFECDLGILINFLNGGENVNCKVPGTEGCTILHIVVGMKKHARKDELLSYLLEMGADPNARSKEDLTPVHIASMWNNYTELEKLLQNKGNPWLVDNENKNAFDLAADHHSYESYQILNRYHSENKLNFRSVADKTQNQLNNSTVFHTVDEHFSFLFSNSNEDEESRSYLLNVSKILRKNKFLENKVERNVNSSQNENCRLLDKAVLFSESGDSSTTSHSEKSNVTVIETDNLSGISLVEEDSLVLPANFGNDSSNFVINDWKSCSISSYLSNSELKLDDRITNDPICGWTSCKSDFSFIPDDSVVISNSFKELSNLEIYQELLKLGDMPGPISDHTRDLYLKRLFKIKSGIYILPLSEPKYCSEIQKFLDGKLNMSKIHLLRNDISAEFNDSKTKTEWREGNQKCCFNYFLLDPRVTQNLPARHAQLTYQETFQTFIDAIFYVGKGTKGRPYSHFWDAVKALAGLHSA
ncbi:ankyrin repeat and LEM domain-containing protein 1 isoform X2 [Parasteatoda tepidariorum]|uniref:ankyrin repeat and LEM domain-containing protein 1 isoform X2 n=1 Tax=Parasteatoda tepidariorum TaxID=114398 RepID=UPI001C727CE3|nr:ankyrin repeat and LEM domain-containing protein 1 isoform X2 [Parasteatoda tepidariorum]